MLVTNKPSSHHPTNIPDPSRRPSPKPVLWCAVAAGAALQPPPPCFWSSWPGNVSGWHHWGTRPNCVTAELGGRRACVLEQLWLSRYQAAALLLGSGVNVLHVDTDMVRLSSLASLASLPSLSHSTDSPYSTDSTDSTSSPGSQALLRDPYLSLKAPPLSSYSLVVLPEKPVNGGLWYARASGRGRGAHWVMEEAMPAG